MQKTQKMQKERAEIEAGEQYISCSESDTNVSENKILKPVSLRITKSAYAGTKGLFTKKSLRVILVDKTLR